jgi:hypothetical protein
VDSSSVQMNKYVRPAASLLGLAATFSILGCGTAPTPESTNASPVKQAEPARPTEPPPAKPCYHRFTPTGMALSKIAIDSKTGQQCRTAENAPPAFRSSRLCFELFTEDRSAESHSTGPCEQRFTPVGNALSRAAVDTVSGQLCRTTEVAAPAFQNAPLCSRVAEQFPN